MGNLDIFSTILQLDNMAQIGILLKALEALTFVKNKQIQVFYAKSFHNLVQHVTSLAETVVKIFVLVWVEKFKFLQIFTNFELLCVSDELAEILLDDFGPVVHRNLKFCIFKFFCVFLAFDQNVVEHFVLEWLQKP